jgi:hypothetical protein
MNDLGLSFCGALALTQSTFNYTVALGRYADTCNKHVLEDSAIDAGSQIEPNVEGTFNENTHEDSEADAERGPTKGAGNIREKAFSSRP